MHILARDTKPSALDVGKDRAVAFRHDGGDDYLTIGSDTIITNEDARHETDANDPFGRTSPMLGMFGHIADRHPLH